MSLYLHVVGQKNSMVYSQPAEHGLYPVNQGLTPLEVSEQQYKQITHNSLLNTNRVFRPDVSVLGSHHEASAMLRGDVVPDTPSRWIH